MRYLKPLFLVPFIGLLGVVHSASAQLLQVGPAQQLMLTAAQAVMKQDYNEALTLYNQAIATDPGNIEAYLQRGVIRRQMKDETGARADGDTALQLADNAIAANPGNAMLYHQRSMANRLRLQFRQAREDAQRAQQLPGANGAWENDVNAIILEEKMHQ